MDILKYAKLNTFPVAVGEVFTPDEVYQKEDYFLIERAGNKFTAMLKPKPGQVLPDLDRVKLRVISEPNEEGIYEVGLYDWQGLEGSHRAGEEVLVKPLFLNRGGLVAEYETHRVFVPKRELLLRSKDLSEYTRRKSIPVKLLKVVVDPDGRETVIGTERGEEHEKKQLAREEQNKELSRFVQQNRGKSFLAQVVRVLDYGILLEGEAFQDKQALLHCSEISMKTLNREKLEHEFKPGDQVDVRLKSFTKGKFRASILYRVLEEEYEELKSLGWSIGEVERWDEKIGAFIKLSGWNVTALLHKSQLDPKRFLDNAKPETKGVLTFVRVSRITSEREGKIGRIFLSQKENNKRRRKRKLASSQSLGSE